MYHMISRQKPKMRFNKLRVGPEEFERQIRWLYENGWTFITMSQIHSNIPRKSVAITFDDGYRDNFLAADKVLQKFNARATLYLVVDRHDRDWSSYKKPHHDEQELMHEPKLLDNDVEQMLSSGRWELGAHSITHANLLTSETETKRNEIHSSRTQLEEIFEVKVSSFAYPFGLFSSADIDVVNTSGFASAVTTEQGITDQVWQERFQLKRIKVSGKDGLRSFQLRMRTGKCRLRD